jgi:hypothetical protein
MAELTPEQARKLLAPIGDVSVVKIDVAATINDVFKIVTRDHGNYYFKFHTARWYADQADTFFVVNRECAVHALLEKRGMPLPYPAWADYTRSVVPRSVYICGELTGTPVTEALARFPQEAADILSSLGRYLHRLHETVFSTPGLLEPAHVIFCPRKGPVPPVAAWDKGALHHAEHFCQEASDALNRCRERGLLPSDVAAAIARLYQDMVATIAPDYTPARFTVGNCHAWHFHVERTDGQWTVLGFYDFEAVSAGDATIDLVELEMTLTPCTGSVTWREPFFAGYGRWPGFEGYKMRALYYLFYELGKAQSRAVPDPAWLNERWLDLIDAQSWQDFVWFPVAV